jgi:uncharacterized membrane protein
MNKMQRENLAKYAYDVSKLVLGGFVIANILSETFSLRVLSVGILVAIVFLVLGYFLNKKEEE